MRLRHIVEDDALIVEILPLEPAADRVVDELLCIEFDGDDGEAFPTSLCLTGFTSHPYSPAAQAARHLLGETLCRAAEEMVCSGDAEREVPLDESVRDSRVRTWRRLTGLAIGIEILPGELRAVLVGADGEIITRDHRVRLEMSPAAVASGIGALVEDMCRQQRGVIAGTEVHLGVQIGGPVDAASGVVHHFHKNDRAGHPGYAWKDAPLSDMLERADRAADTRPQRRRRIRDLRAVVSPRARGAVSRRTAHLPGRRRQADHQRQRGDAHAHGDRQHDPPRGRGTVPMRQARLPRSDGRHACSRRHGHGTLRPAGP